MKQFIKYTVVAVAFITFISPGFACENDILDFKSVHISRLVTDVEHKNFLINTLNSAKKSVMISSYDVSPKIFYNESIGNSIIDAAQRGVKIYIYFEHRPHYSDEDYKKLKVLESCCAKFETNCNHSKCVLKDKDTVAIGSYNWLSCFNGTSINGTIVTTGVLGFDLSEDIWEGMRFYQSLEYENDQGIDNFLEDRDAFQPIIYEFGGQEQIGILRTPEAHHAFLNQTFKDARRYITMFSPFIRLNKLQETFTPTVLSGLTNRNVKTTLVTLPTPYKNPEEQNKIFTVLNQMQQSYPCFSYQTKNDFHAKTLMTDNIICEGSFNWLSAVTETDHHANNYEVSILATGKFAVNLMQEIPSVKTLNQTVSKSPTIPADFDKHIKIFSGAKVNKQGFCVKLDGDYIRDHTKDISYFKTESEAKQAAYDAWIKTHPQPEQKAQIELKRDRPEMPIQSNKKFKTESKAAPSIPKNFDQHIQIFSGAMFNKKGFCVKLDRDYIVDEYDNIAYFKNEFLAKLAAYDVWNRSNTDNDMLSEF